MGFDINYFSAVPVGTKGGNTVFFYFDYAADNVASVFGGTSANTPNATFFKTAYTLYGIRGRAGDIILVSSRSSSTGQNACATPLMLVIPTAWDSNGATVEAAIGMYN